MAASLLTAPAGEAVSGAGAAAPAAPGRVTGVVPGAAHLAGLTDQLRGLARLLQLRGSARGGAGSVPGEAGGCAGDGGDAAQVAQAAAHTGPGAGLCGRRPAP